MSDKFKCKKCDYEYETKNGLLKHIKEKHSLLALVKKYKWLLTIFTFIGIITPVTIFYYSNQPDLQIEPNNVGGADWNNLRYHFNIKNYGKSTANDVEVSLDLNYYAAGYARMKQLPSGESIKFTFDAAPPMSAARPNPFLDYVRKILSGEKVGVGKIVIKYKWLGIPFNGPEYSVVIKRNDFWVYQ